MKPLTDRLTNLRPLRPIPTAWDLVRSPFLFRSRLVKALWQASTDEVESFRNRLHMLVNLIPAIVLAIRWRRAGIGHIHAHWAHTATTVAMHTATLLGVSFSFTGHANDLFVHRVALKAKVRRARFVIAISEYHRRFYESLGGCASRLPVVYCGIDLDRFTHHEGSRENAIPLITSVGRLVEKKGFHDLIEACRILKERGRSFRCVIAGSGPEEATLRHQISCHGMEQLVTVTGLAVKQEELPDLLTASRVFALPCVRDRDGDMDGLPQVLIESLACSVPVVSTELVGIPDLVRQKLTGLLVSPGDVTGLANALELLLNDSNAARKMGLQGEEWVHRHFGRSETVDRLQSLFFDALDRPGNEPPTCLHPPAPGSRDAYKSHAVGSGI
jgi:glycosyltransferase involved in cell wall biosynthesis